MNHLFALLQRAFLAWRGRVMAMALLSLVMLGSWCSEVPLASGPGQPAATHWQNVLVAPFGAARQLLFDSYQRLIPRQRQAQPVTIVEIDERSLKAFGQWPWPRNRLADLIDAIQVHQPLAIGLDLFMPEVDQTSPVRVAANLPAGQEALAQALAQLPSHEDRLAQALRAAPTVLGAAGFEDQTVTSSTSLRTAPILATGDAVRHLQQFAGVLASLPQLQAAAHGQALVSVDTGQTVVRRIPLVMAVNNQAVPSLAMEMLRVATAEPALRLMADAHGIVSVEVADLSVPTQGGGDVWLHFAHREDKQLARQVSAAAVLQGQVAPDALASKLVLIGLTGSGLYDRRTTPLRELVPGVEIQAQLLESFLERRFLLRPWWMKRAELGLMGVVGFLMIWLIPQMRRPTTTLASKLPNSAAWTLMVGCAALLFAGFLSFAVRGWLFDATALLAAYAVVLSSLVSSSMLETQRDNHQLTATQQQLRDSAARLNSELEVARRIQLGSLPDASAAFPGEKRFELAAVLEPAREVGGDLYDFFMVGPNRLCFVVADVSGKGVPASLFMAATKTLTKSFSLRLPGTLGDVVSATNQDLARENVGKLFVTVLIGVLDVDTGALELVNAGHDAPWLVKPDGSVTRIPSPADCGGPPLCVLDDFSYGAQQVQLMPGDTLCLITDGVTEAMNPKNELYGVERLQAVLASQPPTTPLAAVIGQIREDVSAFVSTADASDDITVLMLRWTPRQSG